MMHWCDCGRAVEDHPSDCGEPRDYPDGRPGPCWHIPSLCCPECACGSFNEAHPTSDRATIRRERVEVGDRCLGRIWGSRRVRQCRALSRTRLNGDPYCRRHEWQATPREVA